MIKPGKKVILSKKCYPIVLNLFPIHAINHLNG